MLKKSVSLLLVLLTVTGLFTIVPVTPSAAETESIYKLYDIGKTWEDAEKYCESVGGHLVCITSKEEQEKVAVLLSSGKRNCYWLGGQKVDRKWKWVSGEEFSYTNWASGQPDNYSTYTEDALMMYRNRNPGASSPLGSWNDLKSDGTCVGQEFFGLNNFGFICEWDRIPTSVSVSRSSLTLKIGGSYQLYPVILPSELSDLEVIWSTSDYKVATVTDGKVEATGVGTAYVYCKTLDGQYGVCKITVEPITVDGVELDETMLTLAEGEAWNLTATVRPSTAGDKTVYWSSDDPSIASVYGGRISAKKAGVTTVRATASTGKSASCKVIVTPHDEITDDYILEQVRKYASVNPVVTYNSYISGLDVSNDVKLKMLNELYKNLGFTDAQEGINYFRETDSYRNDYNFLTDNDVYCAYNFYYWLNNTKDGKRAKLVLAGDGLIFNSELTSYLDISTYTEDNYPGIKKCKEFLKQFLLVELPKVEALSYSKKIGKAMRNTLKLNKIVANDVAGTYNFDDIISNLEKATTDADRAKWSKMYSEEVRKYADTNNLKSVTFWGKDIADAAGYAGAVINFADATAEDIAQMLDLSNEINIYRENIDFLENIYNCPKISKDMRRAAKYLIDEIDSGYLNKVKSLLSNVFTLEKDILSVNTNIWKEAFGGVGGTIGSILSTIKIATVIDNILVGTDDYVKNAAYVQGCAEIAVLYSEILKQDRDTFNKKSTVSNAWKFYRDYNLLWELRHYGENRYIELNEIKTILGKAATDEYILQRAVVYDNVKLLEEKKFEYAQNYPVPGYQKYASKMVVNCPVNVSVYDEDGNLITVLRDGKESDFNCRYGRFSVMKQSSTGEYVKVLAFSNKDEWLTVKIDGTDDGFADIKFCKANGSVYSESGIPVKRGTLIESYSVLSGFDYDYNGNGLSVKYHSQYPVNPKSRVTSVDSSEPGEIELEVGDSKTIPVTVSPNSAFCADLVWISGNEDVVSAEGGVLKAIAEGTADVCVRSLDNDEARLSFKVTVLPSDDTEGGEKLLDSAEYPSLRYRLLSDGTAELAEYIGNISALVLPAKIDGYTVSSIGREFARYNKYLVSVTIPEGIKTIGAGAFQDCDNISKITFPDSVEKITGGIFGDTAYSKNEANWENGGLYLKHCLIEVKEKYEGVYNVKPGTTCIAGYAFYSCDYLTDAVIPETVKYIGPGTFGYCMSLTAVPKLPKTITEIGEKMFLYCKSITKITIPGQIVRLGDRAFEDCYSMESIVIPEGVKYLGTDLFRGCSKLTTLTIPKSVETIGDYAFGYGYKYVLDSTGHSSRQTIKYDRTIYGYTGSAAEQYAEKNEIEFIALDGLAVGDVSGDGEVNGADAGILSRYASGWAGYESRIKSMAAADINGDGTVNGADAGILSRYTSGWKNYDKYFNSRSN